jgi:DNA (cytosine-5)-methyltransferase 1
MCGAPPSWCETTCGTLSDGAHMGGGLNGQDATSGRLLVHCGRPRRLTVRECERLQGFPDDHTAIPWRGRPASECPDGPRYRALGNSMAVPVMSWIGRRINEIENKEGP